jgi:hypothetical protein
MSDLTIDLTNFKDRVGQRVAPGRYRVIVDDVEQDVAKTGNTMINLWLRVLDAPEPEFVGAVVIDRLVLTDNSLFRVVGFMQAIGLPTPKKRLKVNIRSWVGKVLDVDLDDGEPYNGRVKSEVRGYMKAAKGADHPSTDLEDLDDIEASDSADVIKGLAQSDDNPLDEASVDLDSIQL